MFRKVMLAMVISGLCLTVLPAVVLAGSDAPAADGAAVWKYISEDRPYTKWSLWPGKGKLYEGREPHGMLLTTYVSKDAKKVIKGKSGEFDNGAFIVKENYKPDKTLAAVTVMYKVKGYNPEVGDWFWAKYGADGSIAKEGKVGGCIKCHSEVAANDYVYTGVIKEGPVADGAAVWKYITEDRPYTKWPLWPGKGKLYKGREPHGMLLTTHVSKDARKVIKGGEGRFKNGAFIVKENYKPDKTLAAVTVMYKVKGYNSEAGDWFWAKYGADGSIAKEGKVGGCINCHGDNRANDWVFTGDISKKVKKSSGSFPGY